MVKKTDDIKELEKTLKKKLGELVELYKARKVPMAEVLMIQDDVEASYSVALDLLAHKKNKEAAKLLGTMCIMQPHDGRYWRILGLALHKIQRQHLALAAYEMALVLLPDDCMTLTYRGETFLLLGRKVEAKKDLEQAIASGKPTSKEDKPFIARAKSLLRYATAQPAQART